MAVAKHIIPGEVFGGLTVIAESPKIPGRPVRRVSAQCKCGVIKDYAMSMLRSGNTKSCGCGREDFSATPQVGNRYGRLEVVGPFISTGNQRKVVCRCDCGNAPEVHLLHLHKGLTKSCGCLRSDTKSNLVHGLSSTRTYASWVHLRNRCSNPQNPHWRSYGGRGITVCERWSSFENFFADMGEAPDFHTIDRIDNSLGYDPANCRWATPKQQANNTRRNRKIEFEGEIRTVSQWGDHLGLEPDVLHDRIKRGWSVRRMLTEPKHPAGQVKHDPAITHEGRTQSLSAWAHETGVKYHTLKKRLRVLGWSIERSMTTPVR